MNLPNTSNQFDSADSDDEIDLFDLLSFLGDHWTSLLGGAGAAGLVGLGVAFVLPAQYEVVMPIQISEVGEMGRFESPAVVIERIKSDGFKSRLAKDSKDVYVKASVKVDPIKGTELILLKARANSVETANEMAQSVLQALAAEHRRQAEPYRQRMKAYLADLQQEQVRARKTRDDLLASIIKPTSGQGISDDAMLLRTNLLMLQDNYLQSLSLRVLTQQVSMDPAKDFDTRAFVDAVTEEDRRPVFPRPEIFSLIGFVSGGFVMLVWLAVSRFCRQRVGYAKRVA